MPKERRQIAVYPDRFTLLWYAFLYLLGMGAFALCGYWIVTGTYRQSGNPMYGWIFGLLGSLGLVGQIVGGGLALFFMFWLAVVLVCTLYRLIIRRPSVIVNSDGITDHCSLIAGGAGFIGWDETAALMVTLRERHDLYHVTTVRRSHFVVLLHNEQAIVSRLHPLVRRFLPSYTRKLGADVDMPQWLLSVPVSELLADIQRRYGQTMNAHSVSVLGSAKPPLQR